MWGGRRARQNKLTKTTPSIASLRSNTGKIRQTFDRQAVDCNLVVLKIALRQLHRKDQTHFSALRATQQLF
jgi:hypothetical protein